MDALKDQLGSLSIETGYPNDLAPSHHVDLVESFLHRYPTHWQKSDIIFMSLDYEAFEWDQKKVTEIGIAILDTRDVRNVDPYMPFAAIMDHIKTVHYRPTEYAKLINKRFVHGCPTAFAFGTSTWIKLDDAVPILERIFQDPPSIYDAARFDVEIPITQRNVIMVGHGLGNDDKYLQTLGFSLKAVANVVGEADTQRFSLSKIQVSLKKLLSALEIDAVNLYNAGNDAVYTLQAFVTTLTLDAASPGQLDRDLLAIDRRPQEKYNTGVIAPTAWGGTAVVGDERSVESKTRRTSRRGFHRYIGL